MGNEWFLIGKVTNLQHLRQTIYDSSIEIGAFNPILVCRTRKVSVNPPERKSFRKWNLSVPKLSIELSRLFQSIRVILYLTKCSHIIFIEYSSCNMCRLETHTILSHGWPKNRQYSFSTVWWPKSVFFARSRASLRHAIFMYSAWLIEMVMARMNARSQ